jgi:transketolase
MRSDREVPTEGEVGLLREKARHIRLETIRLIEIAKVGHYSSVFSCAEIFAALYYDVMRLRPGEPQWPDRDRFLMGKGHAAVGLFPVLADHGFIARELLDGYTRLGSPLGDHPDMSKVPGVDFSSGSIGHALSNGVGMAVGGRMSGRDFNNRLSRLVAIVDRNGYQLDGKVDDVMGVESLKEKWQAFGWEVHEVDGHDLAELTALLRRLRADESRARPACVIAKTIKGKGVSYMETEPGWHLGYLAPQDAQSAVEEILSREI